MDECRDFACNDADGPGLCHPSTCPKLKGRPDVGTEPAADAGADSSGRDAGVDSSADSEDFTDSCFTWGMQDDGTVGVVPCPKPEKPKTEAEKLKEAAEEIRARTGLQRF